MAAGLRAVAGGLALLRATQAVSLRPEAPSWVLEGDHIADRSHMDARPGTPEIADWGAQPDLGLFEDWRYALGERVVKLADAHDAMAKCGSFTSFGDFSWCKKAMPKEANAGLKEGFRAVHEYVVNKDIAVAHPQAGDSFLALSFGVETTDCWSELMSSLYYVETQLFDCYYSGSQGPLSNDWHGNHSRSNPCTGRHCYTEAYHKNRVCLDDTSTVKAFTDTGSRKYQSLFVPLEGRAPLSTFVKMDVEGSEWGTIERLLENDQQLAKIRTLDMEVHFNMQPRVRDTDQSTMVAHMSTPSNKASLTHLVELLERLTHKFAVTGSTLEPVIRKKRSSRGAHIVSRQGYDLDQFCISFVNRALL